jgi:hypothetical protein
MATEQNQTLKIYEVRHFEDSKRRTIIQRTMTHSTDVDDMLIDKSGHKPVFSGRGRIQDRDGTIDIEFKIAADNIVEAFRLFDVSAEAAVAELKEKALQNRKKIIIPMRGNTNGQQK